MKWPGPASVVAQRVWNLALVAPYQRQHDEDPVAGPVSCYHPLYVTMSVCQLQGTLLGAVSVLLPPPEIAAEVRNITSFWVRIPSNNAPCSVWPFPYIRTYIHTSIHTNIIIRPTSIASFLFKSKGTVLQGSFFCLITLIASYLSTPAVAKSPFSFPTLLRVLLLGVHYALPTTA